MECNLTFVMFLYTFGESYMAILSLGYIYYSVYYALQGGSYF